MKVKIGFIYSFFMQKEMIKDISQERSDEVEVLMECGVLEEAIPKAKRLEQMGAEVILSWAGTARILERELSIPVAYIQIQDFDVMRAVRQACNFGEKIAILTPWPLNGMDLLEQLYKIKIKQIFYDDRNDVCHGAIEAFNEGYEVLIGKSNMPLDLAREYGKKAVLITFNKDSVKIAFDEAIRLANLRRKERENYTLLETIFNSLIEGVIVCDNFGKITWYNHTAEDILGIKPNNVLGQSFEDILPFSQAIKSLEQRVSLDDVFLNIHNDNIIASHVPIIVGEKSIGVVTTLRKASEIQKIDSKIRKKMISSGFIAKYKIEHFSSGSSEMKKLIEKARKFAGTDSNVLITGETGTGKEVMAQSIHNLSLRKQRPFVAINCSVLPDNLLESELFGYEGGAFTGARKEGKIGLFELGHGGTIFLDEISTMPINLQSKLLRVIQEKEVMRLGGERLIPIDVRIIASANDELVSDIKNRQFREDLFFRLNVLTIRMPALRDRKKDIPGLVSYYISYYSKKYGKNNIILPKKDLKKLQNYYWLGNVRQLENVIEKIVLIYDRSSGTDLTLDDLLLESGPFYQNFSRKGNNYKTKLIPEKAEAKSFSFPEILKQEEMKRIVLFLENNNFNKSNSASQLGISRSTLYRKLRALDIKCKS